MIEIMFDKLVLQFPESIEGAVGYLALYEVGQLMFQEMDRRGLDKRKLADKKSFYEPIQEALATHSSVFVRIAVASQGGSGAVFLVELRDDTVFNLLHDGDPRVRAAILLNKSRIPKVFDRVKRPQLERMFSELLDSRNDEVLTIAASSEHLPKFMKSNPAAVEKLLLEAPNAMVIALICNGDFGWDVLSRVVDRGNEFALILIGYVAFKYHDKFHAELVSICLRLSASPDVAIRVRVAESFFFRRSTSNELRETAERWLLQEPFEVVDCVLSAKCMYEPDPDLKLMLECANRGDEFALAIAEKAFNSDGQFPDAGRAELLRFLTQHPSVAVRKVMAGAEFLSDHAELIPVVAPMMEILARDANADVARCAQVSRGTWNLTTGGIESASPESEVLRGLVKHGDAEEILTLLSTVDDLDAVGGRKVAESAFKLLMESDDASLRVRAAEMPSVSFFEDFWERLLDDDDPRVVDGFLSNGELFQQLPTATLLAAAKRSDAMAIRIAQAYGQCAESLDGKNKLLKLLQKHQNVDVRRALASVFHSDLPIEGWRVLAQDKDDKTAELAKQSLAELTADN